jgi:hypothetical protein
MAGNSLESLLAWMRNDDNEIMWGWNAIAAMARSKTNTLLLQEYIARFSGNSYFEPINGEVELSEGKWKEKIHDFILDAPRLSFESANLNDSRATLTCSIMGGIQLSTQLDVDVWLVATVAEIDPLEGPKLILQLNLGDVPGDVLDDGRVRLDLNRSSDFILTFVDTPQGQRLGGDFFKDYFEGLDEAQRIWTLGRIQPGLHTLMTPESFTLRTQANGVEARDRGSPNYGDGAVLIFIRMKGSPEGGGVNPEYRYLIPDDAGQDYSATVLLERERTLLAAVLTEIGAMINSEDFVINYENGHVENVVAQAGGLRIAGETYSLPIVGGVAGADISAFTLPAASLEPLTLVFNDSLVDLTWKTSSSADVSFVVIRGRPPYPVNKSVVVCSVELLARYELQDDPEEGPLLKQISMDYIADLTYLDSHSSTDSPQPVEDEVDWGGIMALFLAFFVRTFGPVDLRKRIEEAFRSQFSINLAVAPFIQDSIKLAFGQAIEGDDIYAPRDVGFFGRINPIRTSFHISPMEPLMAAGGRQQFTTEPVMEGLTWAVTALPQQTDYIGSITQDGLYQAPGPDDVTGRFVRVRVTATDSTGQYYSSALVTVLVNELTINPLIQSCFVNQSVTLKAGALGGGELTWAIKSPGPGSGRIELIDGDHKYVAATQPIDKETYVLDEVEVTNPVTGGKRSARVLAIHSPPGLKVRPIAEPGLPLPPGQLRLQAKINNPMTVEWTLPLGGPGSISHYSGDNKYALYQADPLSTERFVLIFANLEDENFGTFRGHIILPLPLTQFPDELELMKVRPDA